MSNKKMESVKKKNEQQKKEKQNLIEWKKVWRDSSGPLFLLFFIVLMLLGFYFPPNIGVIYQAVLLLALLIGQVVRKVCGCTKNDGQEKESLSSSGSSQQ